MERYYVKLLNSSETQAEVALYIVNNWDHSLRDPYIVTCTLKNGHLVFDMVIDLPQDKPYFISYSRGVFPKVKATTLKPTLTLLPNKTIWEANPMKKLIPANITSITAVWN